MRALRIDSRIECPEHSSSTFRFVVLQPNRSRSQEMGSVSQVNRILGPFDATDFGDQFCRSSLVRYKIFCHEENCV